MAVVALPQPGRCGGQAWVHSSCAAAGDDQRNVVSLFAEAEILNQLYQGVEQGSGGQASVDAQEIRQADFADH